MGGWDRKPELDSRLTLSVVGPEAGSKFPDRGARVGRKWVGGASPSSGHPAAALGGAGPGRFPCVGPCAVCLERVAWGRE